MDNASALHSIKDIIVKHDSRGNAKFVFKAILNLVYGKTVINESHTCEITNVIGFDDISFQINTESAAINSINFHTQFSSNFSTMDFNPLNKFY